MSRIAVIGIGAVGCRILDVWATADEEMPPHLALHTDRAILDECRAESRMLLGRDVLRGLSAGGDVQLAREAFDQDRNAVAEWIDGADVLYLVAGLGGGTGTAVSREAADLARQQGALVIAFVTLPFFFEGQEKRRRADDGLRALRQAADAVICLPNQRMNDWAGEETPLAETFARVNEMVIHNVRAMIGILQRPGVLSLNFSDFRQMITHSGGVCVMGYGEGRGTHRVDEAVQMVRNNPVLGRDDVLRKAGGLLVGITGGPRLSLSEVEQIMSAVTEVSHPDVHLFMGAAVNDAWDDRVGIAVLAAEAWVDEAERAADDEEAEGEQAGAGGGGASESPRAAHAGGKRKRRKSVQTSLSIGPSGRGRFNDVEPTIVQGEDLDAPTFLRRGVKLVR